jgi:hypothetical protein
MTESSFNPSQPVPPPPPDASGGAAPYAAPGAFNPGYGYATPPPPPAPPPFVPPPVNQMANQVGDQAKGFLGKLFDLSFSSFVTPSIAKLFYLLAIAAGALGWVGLIISGFTWSAVLGILAILLGWIPPFIGLILLRLVIEFALAAIKTAENTSHLRGN